MTAERVLGSVNLSCVVEELFVARQRPRMIWTDRQCAAAHPPQSGPRDPVATHLPPSPECLMRRPTGLQALTH